MTDDLERIIRAAIGYEPVPLSIRNHPEITAEFRTAADADGLVERISTAIRKHWQKDREHIVQVPAHAVPTLRRWLESPNGAHTPFQRLTVEAVQGGGILVRTKPYGEREEPCEACEGQTTIIDPISGDEVAYTCPDCAGSGKQRDTLTEHYKRQEAIVEVLTQGDAWKALQQMDATALADALINSNILVREA